jgi:hypothetical protein
VLPSTNSHPDGSPETQGWIRTDHPADQTADADVRTVFPRDGGCSVHPCDQVPFAAVRRGSSRRRPLYWQNYCEPHASERGVDRAPAGLSWTAAFLAVRPSPHR